MYQNERSIFPALALCVLAAVGIAAAHESKSQKQVTVEGHVVGLACYFGHGSMGDGHRECAEKCAKAGIPLAILDAKSKTLYLPLAKNHHDPANAELLPFVEQDVKVTGRVVEKDGMKAILIEKVIAARARDF